MTITSTTRNQASHDFSKARTRELFSRIIHILTPQKNQLLNFRDIRSLLRPQGEVYKGMLAVPIQSIIGSEGRYHDFNSAFLPKSDHTRSRWESIDKAHMRDIALPPVKLYKVGDFYFVRDGNHRISVAKLRGELAIDAEVIELKTEYKLDKQKTLDVLKEELIQHEKANFIQQTHLDDVIPMEHLEFSTPGRYDEILQHIHGHKYFINLTKPEEISLENASISWYYNVFLPTVQCISEDGIISRFPGRTKADLYLWIVAHWDELKRKYGEKISLKEATRDYSNRKGLSLWHQFLGLFKRN